jgi:hypothetical protein
LGIRGV